MESRLGQGDGVEVQGRSRQVGHAIRPDISVELAKLHRQHAGSERVNLGQTIAKKVTH